MFPQIIPEFLQPEILPHIYNNHDFDYYWTDDWSPHFYSALARAGFISVAFKEGEEETLLPQLQFEYALLDWENLHISSDVKRMARLNRFQERNYELRFNYDFDAVLQSVQHYHDPCWLIEKYAQILRSLRDMPEKGFQLLTTELRSGDELVAAEIGYMTGAVYTSLTGFCNRRPEHRNTGKLQMTLLGKILQESGAAFWNLGHPHMAYKQRLRAAVLPRADFLKRWIPAVSKSFTFNDSRVMFSREMLNVLS